MEGKKEQALNQSDCVQPNKEYSLLTVNLPSATLVPYANSLDPDETDPSSFTLRQHFSPTLSKIEAL